MYWRWKARPYVMSPIGAESSFSIHVLQSPENCSGWMDSLLAVFFPKAENPKWLWSQKDSERMANRFLKGCQKNKSTNLSFCHPFSIRSAILWRSHPFAIRSGFSTLYICSNLIRHDFRFISEYAEQDIKSVWVGLLAAGWHFYMRDIAKTFCPSVPS